MIAENIYSVKTRIACACRKAGRDPGEVKVVCVAKGVDAGRVREAVRAGMRDIGENRVQEAVEKHGIIGNGIQWHMIGHLQTNKTSDAVSLFSLIHSVDSERLARKIDQCARRISKIQDILIQVNISEEKSKFGVVPQKTAEVVEKVSALANVRIIGLMGMARFTDDPEDARSSFRLLRRICEDIRSRSAVYAGVRHLSMGMSQDFEVAVEEGATMVRVGSEIFMDH